MICSASVKSICFDSRQKSDKPMWQNILLHQIATNKISFEIRKHFVDSEIHFVSTKINGCFWFP